MKNIIPLNNFLLEEALPLNTAKRYVKMGLERNPLTTAKMDVIFNNKQRLYIPVVKKVKSTMEPQIASFLKEIGYGIKDYLGNLAFKLDNPKREVKIGKLLSQNGKEDLRNLFLGDPIRELATQQAEYSVVVCRHPYDLAGMSGGTGREAWHSSCLNIDGGCNSHYVPKEIKNGTLTAYYIKTTDKNINKPLGRVNIKPYKKEEELNQKDKQKCYFPDTRIYGSFPPDAILALKEWIISWQGDLTGDFYKWKGCYDYDGTAYHIRVNSNMDIKQIEATKGNRNVDNFDIVNDVDDEDPWGEAPDYGTYDVEGNFDTVRDFKEFLQENSNDNADGVEPWDWDIMAEFEDGWYVSSSGYLWYATEELILNSSEMFSWYTDEEFRCGVVKIKDLTFDGFSYDDFVEFFPRDLRNILRVPVCSIGNSITFKDCFLSIEDKPIQNGYCNEKIPNFEKLIVRELREINIIGGDCTNAISIINMILDLKGLSNSSFVETINTITLKDIEKGENLGILKKLISKKAGGLGSLIKIKVDYIEKEEEGTIGNREDGTWAKKYLDDPHPYKKIDWYKMMGGGIETNNRKGTKIIFTKDGSGLVWLEGDTGWSLY